MISDLIEFGKWLDENNQDDFGKLIQDDDRVIKINIKYQDGTLEFEDLNRIIKDSLDNYDSIKTYSEYKHENNLSFSLFSNQLFFETNQNIMIPSNDAFACLTPFVVSLKRIENTKIKRSKKRNEEGLEFINLISELKKSENDLLNYYDNYGDINKLNSNKLLFNETFENTETIIEVINQYYGLLDDNYEIIQDLKNKITGRDPDIFLYFELPDQFLLFNDMVYFYCKYLKQRAESIDESKINIENPTNCQFCGNENICFVKFSSIGIGFESYNWNYTSGLHDSKLKICRNCSAYLYLSIQKLIHVFEKYFILIPKLKTNNEDDFKFVTTELNSYYNEIRSKRKSKFILLNNFLSNTDYNRYFNFDFLIFEKTRMGEDVDKIKKYVENYKAYLVNFENKNIELYGDKRLNYLLNEPFKKGKNEKSKIENIFDLEFIFKQFFSRIEDEKIEISKKFDHFYEIYTKKLTGKTGILYRFDAKTVSIFAKYMHNIFNLIYELNEDALNKNMLNEIVFNSLIKLQKHNKLNKKNPMGLFYFDILRRLNYYFMLKKELLGDEMLKEGSVGKLKEIGLKYNMDSELEKIAVDDSNHILKTIENDPALKYYIIGQFLGLIDSSKRTKNKKAEVFSNFVTNANRNNVRNLFVTEVLQKNNYYIEKMNKKGKFIFKLFEKDMNSLFNEVDGFSFEDYLLLIFTGYYTENVLSSRYGAKEKEAVKNE